MTLFLTLSPPTSPMHISVYGNAFRKALYPVAGLAGIDVSLGPKERLSPGRVRGRRPRGTSEGVPLWWDGLPKPTRSGAKPWSNRRPRRWRWRRWLAACAGMTSAGPSAPGNEGRGMIGTSKAPRFSLGQPATPGFDRPLSRRRRIADAHCVQRRDPRSENHGFLANVGLSSRDHHGRSPWID
jgi:hypothetical protein